MCAHVRALVNLLAPSSKTCVDIAEGVATTRVLLAIGDMYFPCISWCINFIAEFVLYLMLNIYSAFSKGLCSLSAASSMGLSSRDCLSTSRYTFVS